MGIRYGKGLLLFTDAAPYMIKGGKGHQILCPEMIHVTCVTHAMLRIAEEQHGAKSRLFSVELFLKVPSAPSPSSRNGTRCSFAAAAHLDPVGSLGKRGTVLQSAHMLTKVCSGRDDLRCGNN